MVKVSGGAKDHGHEVRMRRDPLRDEVRRALSVTYLVGGDERQQCLELWLPCLLAEAAKEVRGEVLAEHELDERSHEVRGIEVAAIGALPDLSELLVGDPRLVPDRVEVHAKRVEVLEALVHLQRE